MAKNNQPANERENGAVLNGNPEVGYEQRDINFRTIALLGLALLLTAVIVHFIVAWQLRALTRAHERHDQPISPLRIGAPPEYPPEPRLQGSPAHPALPQQDLHDLENSANAQLNSYGWVDQSTGIAHIPISEAMKRLIQTGLPPSNPAAANPNTAAQGAPATGGPTPAAAQR